MAENCIFCRISRGEVPSTFLYQDEDVFAIRDIQPRAPVHLLVIPRAHIPAVSEVTPEQAALLGKLFLVANRLAAQEGVAESGYRLVMNCGPDAGQGVAHLHLHLLGGKRLGMM